MKALRVCTSLYKLVPAYELGTVGIPRLTQDVTCILRQKGKPQLGWVGVWGGFHSKRGGCAARTRQFYVCSQHSAEAIFELALRQRAPGRRPGPGRLPGPGASGSEWRRKLGRFSSRKACRISLRHGPPDFRESHAGSLGLRSCAGNSLVTVV